MSRRSRPTHDHIHVDDHERECPWCERSLSLDRFYSSPTGRFLTGCKDCRARKQREARKGRRANLKRLCSYCDGPVSPDLIASAKYCSERCRDLVALDKEKASYSEQACPGCSQPFTPRHANRKYCGECGHYRSKTLARHHLTGAQFDHLMSEQGSACAICQTSLDEETVRVDHDHSCCPTQGSCGKCVRGILCQPCNSALGMLRDNPAFCREAANYLERFENE
jgi:ribosomal protein S27AE